MRIFVTGAFGYLGLALIGRLSAQASVVAFGHPPRNPAAWQVVPHAVEKVFADLAEAPDALRRRAPFDAVIHLAGGGGSRRCEADPAGTVRTNILGTSALAAAAGLAGVSRLLYASTIAVYGTERASAEPYRETDPAVPDDLYGAVKEAAEHVWTAHARGSVLRLSNVYGAGAGIDMGIDGAVERFARAAAAGGEITIYGGGSQCIDYVHVDDVAEAFGLALVARDLPAVLHVGGGRPVSIRGLAEACLAAGRELGRSPRLVEVAAPDGKVWPDRSLAIDLAAAALGWRPQVRLEEGLRGLVEMMARSVP